MLIRANYCCQVLITVLVTVLVAVLVTGLVICLCTALTSRTHCPAGEETASEKNTFVLRLQITCKRQGTQMVNDRGEPYLFPFFFTPLAHV